MEIHAGRESLAGWVQREALPSLRGAGSWHELHEQLHRHGLALRRRGAGLVFATIDGRDHVRASQVSRDLTLSQLTNRLGPYAEPTRERTLDQVLKRYVGAPRQRERATPHLFAEFERERSARLIARRDGLKAINDELKTYAEQLAVYHRRRREQIQKSPGSQLNAYRRLAQERRADWQRRKELARDRRKNLMQMNSLPVWQTWLMDRASAGDEAALAVLRSRANRAQQRPAANWLSGSSEGSIAAALAGAKTDKAGTVHYRFSDGTCVRDGLRGVHVDKATHEAAMLAVEIAAAKYGQQKLVVDGSAEFRSLVATIAGRRGSAVEFADPALEAIRRGAGANLPPTHPVKPNLDAIDSYVEARNRQRAMVSTIPHHRRFQAEDAGFLEYQGRRALANGQEVILLASANSEQLVVAASAAQAAKASTWKKGQQVEIDKQGRLLTPAGERTKPRRSQGRS